jgi:hypothetical protein
MSRVRMVEGLIEMSGCFVDILGECVVCRWEILKILPFVGVISDVLSGQQTSQTTYFPMDVFPKGRFVTSKYLNRRPGADQA